jgi:hypothetical protein
MIKKVKFKILLLRLVNKLKIKKYNMDFNLYLNQNLYFKNHYEEWNHKRYTFIRHLLGTTEINKMKVLEVSGGHANLGKKFYDLGCEVTVTDGRSEHVNSINTLYPGIKTEIINLENNWPALSRFDIVIHFGVLYHLSDPLKHLENFLLSQDFDHLFLETEVSNHPDKNFVFKIKEFGYDQSLSTIGGRPSSSGIETVLSNLSLDWERHDNVNLDCLPHNYSWQEYGTLETYWSGMRRFYHIQKFPQKL